VAGLTFWFIDPRCPGRHGRIYSPYRK
jgi:hypothetical protein